MIPVASQAAASAKAPVALRAPEVPSSMLLVAGTAEVTVPRNSKTPLDVRALEEPDRLTGPVKVILPPRLATAQVVAPPTRLPVPVNVSEFGTTISSVRLKQSRPDDMVIAPAPREPTVEVARPSTAPSTLLRPT